MSKRRMWSVGALAAVVAFFAWRMLAPPPEDLDLARSKPTVNGLYSLALAPEMEPLRREALHSWLLTVTRDGAPVEDARIAVDGGMPQHGHGLPTAPQATAYFGEGRYRIEGVRFNMDGWWELRVTVDAAAGKDDAVFNLVF
jgi:hypothetical protein